jgi:hypothetical protein
METSAKAILDKTGVQATPYPERKELIHALLYNAEVFQRNITGAATAIDVDVPFDPALAVLINETGTVTVYIGTSLKAAATGISIAAAAALVAANGFTFTPKSGSTSAKVTLGTGLQTTNDVCRLIVFGFDKNPS